MSQSFDAPPTWQAPQQRTAPAEAPSWIPPPVGHGGPPAKSRRGLKIAAGVVGGFMLMSLGAAIGDNGTTTTPAASTSDVEQLTELRGELAAAEQRASSAESQLAAAESRAKAAENRAKAADDTAATAEARATAAEAAPPPAPAPAALAPAPAAPAVAEGQLEDEGWVVESVNVDFDQSIGLGSGTARVRNTGTAVHGALMTFTVNSASGPVALSGGVNSVGSGETVTVQLVGTDPFEGDVTDFQVDGSY